MKTKILILCTGNSCRSQMAQGWIDHYDTENKLQVYSAGVETHGVNPKAIQVMNEAGVDISHHTSNHIDEYRNINFNYVITVCDHTRENCPGFHLMQNAFTKTLPTRLKPPSQKKIYCKNFDA